MVQLDTTIENWPQFDTRLTPHSHEGLVESRCLVCTVLRSMVMLSIRSISFAFCTSSKGDQQVARTALN